MSKHHSYKKRTSLRVYVDGYLQYLAIHGYTESTQEHYRTDLLRLISYFERNGIFSARRFSNSFCNILADVSASRWARRCIRSTANRFIEYLIQQNLIPDPTIAIPKTKHAQLIAEFVQFQVEHRGVCSGYATHIKSFCECFLIYLKDRGIRRLVSLKPVIVLEFIAEEGKVYTRRTMSDRCSVLRTFLTYLYRKGIIHLDLAGVVIGPHIFKSESCPRFISTVQVKTVLSQIDCSTMVGLRDYAMILLLATYGLRGIEVIRLRLKDIDWRRRIIHINGRKGGNNSDYPLVPSVAEALAEYLQKARPHSNDRHIFLSAKTPHRPFIFTWGMGDRIRQYMRKACVKVNRPGEHTFRYSCAQSLLNQKTPLKVISDYLGHMQPETTQLYIKISLEDLREVACGDGEEVVL